MVDVAEHVYHDDPSDGHPDVRTRLADVAYFFLGNGVIQAAVQHAPSGDGTPLGLLIMDPDRLRKKRDALTMHPVRGLEPTRVELAAPDGAIGPDPRTLRVGWDHSGRQPVVEARWQAGDLDVVERFCCPTAAPRVSRTVELVNRSQAARTVMVQTSGLDAPVGAALHLAAGGRAMLWLAYDLDPATQTIQLRLTQAGPLDRPGHAPQPERTVISFGEPLLDHLFRCAASQLPAAISRRGCLDGSIWQYSREWVRDQAAIAVALMQLGHQDLAATILHRLLYDFVTPDGATLDSSETRGRDDVELDQNGALLQALAQYAWWTGNFDFVAAAWPRVTALAEYPLRDEFRHEPSGLLWGRREYWERHAAHGIEAGFEMIYQVAVAAGLADAAALASHLGHGEQAARWSAAAARLRHTVLDDPAYRMHDGDRGFVKRLRLDGTVQEGLTPGPGANLPPGVPLAAAGPHPLNPDTCCVLPFVLGLADPASALAAATLNHVDGLWNQAWGSGGYGRYHVAGEPDSPGPWPFASIFVARAAVEAGDSRRFWRILRWLNTVPGSAAGSWFEFYGPRVAPPFPQVGIIPWTWAELVLLFVTHVLGVRPGPDGLRIRPRLPAGLDRVEARLPVGAGWLHLTVEADALSTTREAVSASLPADDVHVALSVPSLP